MAQDPDEQHEEFDLRLEWPRDRLIEPMDPTAKRQADEPAPALDEENGADGEAPVEQITHPDTSGGDTEQLVKAEQSVFFSTLQPSVADLVADYESLVSAMSTFRNVVSGNLSNFIDEVGFIETVSGGSLKQYRDAHVRTLTELRHLVGDNAAWVQWLADSVREMATAVDDAAHAVRDVGDSARLGVTRTNDSVNHMTDTVRWLGEQLRGSLRELRNVAPGGADADAAPLLESEGAVDRALVRLDEAPKEDVARATARDGGARASLSDPRFEKELSRLADEVRASRSIDVDLLEELLERMRNQTPGVDGDESDIRSEIGRLADELQALRRRLNLRAKTPATLEPDQIAAIADAVVEALGESAQSGSARRRPLEARRTVSTQTRRPRD